jgi:hypothetical protein
LTEIEIQGETEIQSEAVDRPSVEDVMGSLNGFDEIAIEQRFGDLSGLSGMRTVRALQFVRIRRGGVKDPDAYAAAMALTLRELQELFAQETSTGGEAAEEESDAEGKGD